MAKRDFCMYTPDDKFFVLGSYARNAEELIVPVALIDEIIERGVSLDDLNRLLLARYETAGRNTRRVRMSELEGEDLTDKTVGVRFFGQDDYHPEWIWVYSENVTTVVKVDEWSYKFVLSEGSDECQKNGCKHNWEEMAPCDHICGELRFSDEFITVTDKGSVQIRKEA